MAGPDNYPLEIAPNWILGDDEFHSLESPLEDYRLRESLIRNFLDLLPSTEDEDYLDAFEEEFGESARVQREEFFRLKQLRPVVAAKVREILQTEKVPLHYEVIADILEEREPNLTTTPFRLLRILRTSTEVEEINNGVFSAPGMYD